MHLVRIGLAPEEARQLLDAAGSVKDLNRDDFETAAGKLSRRTDQSPLPALLQRLAQQQQTSRGKLQQLAAEDRVRRRNVFTSAFASGSSADVPSIGETLRNDANSTPGRLSSSRRRTATAYDPSKARMSSILDWRKLFQYRTPLDVEMGVCKNASMGAFGGLQEEVGVAATSGRENDIVKRTIAKDDSLILVRVEGDDHTDRQALPRSGAVEFVSFGEAVKATLYSLSLAGTFANAGSYGATPRGVVRAVEAIDVMEQLNPMQFDVDSRWVLCDEVTERLSRFLGCSAEDLLLLPNCNTATSTALKSLPWEPRDRFLILSCEYDATVAAAQWLVAQFGVVLETLDVSFPISDDSVVESLRGRLLSLHICGRLPRLANFCHVTSKTAWIFPIKRMVAVCHEYGVPVLVDGAHAPGHVMQLNLDDIGADLYCGTCHKWMFSCQGVAFLVAHPRWHSLMDPLVPTGYATQYMKTSSASDVTDPSSQVHPAPGSSAALGPSSALDASTMAFRFRMSIMQAHLPSFLSLWTAMDFAEHVCGGWARVMQYQCRLAEEAAVYLHKEWELDKEGIIDPCVQWCQMGETGKLVNVAVEDSGDDKMSHASRRTGQHRRSMKSSEGVDPAALLRSAATVRDRPTQISQGVGNSMPLIPIPNSRNATEKDAKTLMGYLLTRFNITCFIAVSSVIAYIDDAPTRLANSPAGPPRSSGGGVVDPGPSSVAIDWARGPVKMLVLRFTAQVHVSHSDVRTIGAAVRAVQLSSSVAAGKLVRRDMANASASLQPGGESSPEAVGMC